MKHLAFVALVISVLPLTIQHFLALWQKPHYQFFPLLLGFVAIVLTLRTREQLNKATERTELAKEPAEPTEHWLSFEWALLILSFVGALLATAYNSPLIAYGSAAFAILGWGHARYGAVVGKIWFAPWLLLFLCVPPPFGYDAKVVQKLQLLTSEVAGVFLDQVGVNHLRNGIEIELPKRQLFVDEACSGINSISAVIVAVLCAMIWSRSGFVTTALLTAYSVVITAIMNTTRIFLIVYCLDKRKWDLVEEPYHSALGIVLFLVAVGFCFSFYNLLGKIAPLDTIWKRFWLRWITTRKSKATGEQTTQSQSTSKVGWIVSIVYLFAPLAIGAQLLVWYVSNRAYYISAPKTDKVADSLFNKDLADWKFVDIQTIERDRGNDEGELSKIWTFEAQGMRPQLSIDLPFSGFHELSRCYTGRGWQIVGRTEHLTEDPDRPFVELTFRNGSGESGYLVFQNFDPQGNVLGPPQPISSMKKIQGRLTHIPILSALGLVDNNVRDDYLTYQIQVWVNSSVPLNDLQKSSVKRQFDKFSKQFSEVLK